MNATVFPAAASEVVETAELGPDAVAAQDANEEIDEELDEAPAPQQQQQQNAPPADGVAGQVGYTVFSAFDRELMVPFNSLEFRGDTLADLAFVGPLKRTHFVPPDTPDAKLLEMVRNHESRSIIFCTNVTWQMSYRAEFKLKAIRKRFNIPDPDPQYAGRVVLKNKVFVRGKSVTFIVYAPNQKRVKSGQEMMCNIQGKGPYAPRSVMMSAIAAIEGFMQAIGYPEACEANRIAPGVRIHSFHATCALPFCVKIDAMSFALEKLLEVKYNSNEFPTATFTLPADAYQKDKKLKFNLSYRGVVCITGASSIANLHRAFLDMYPIIKSFACEVMPWVPQTVPKSCVYEKRVATKRRMEEEAKRAAAAAKRQKALDEMIERSTAWMKRG